MEINVDSKQQKKHGGTKWKKAIYTVVVITDGAKEWANNYDNALDAVNVV
jgi:hypothetical protein